MSLFADFKYLFELYLFCTIPSTIKDNLLTWLTSWDILFVKWSIFCSVFSILVSVNNGI